MSVDFRVVAVVSVAYALLLYQLSPRLLAGVARDEPRPSLGGKMLGEKAVTEMLLHAWTGYMENAAGADELMPVSGSPKNNWGATAVTAFDSLSTLLVAGLTEQFQDAAELALEGCEKFKMTANPYDEGFESRPPTSVFETTIRHLGSVLSAYSQTKDARFLECAEAIAEALLPAFKTTTGIALHGVVVGSGRGSNEAWAGFKSILSEVGSLQLEFRYLSHFTGKPIYAEAANGFTRHLISARRSGWPMNSSLYEKDAPKMPHRGLWPAFVDPHTGLFSGAASMASLSDSFYEYLLKQWIAFGKTDAQLLELYEDSIEALMDHLLRYTPDTHYAILGHVGIGYEPTMDHLTCFVPGMLVLGTMHGAHRSEGRNRTWGDDKVLRVAMDLATTCFRLYAESPSGIGPEIVQFHLDGNYSVAHPKYILRPETIESLFYLYRYTGDRKYVQWGRHIAAHLDKHCRTPSGFAALESVTEVVPKHVDSMESFFFAETLKYLYLLIEADADAVPLDRFVFNTEGHPLPIL